MAPSPSLRDVAAATGLSVATVSRALRGDPAVREETRWKVAAAAGQLGYKGNAYLSGMMSAFRKKQGAAYRENLAFLWLNPMGRSSGGAGNSYFDGAQARAAELGYSLEAYNMTEYGSTALSRILSARGIRGLIVAPPVTQGKAHLRFKLDGFVAVALGWGLLRPELDVIRYDYYAMIRLAIHHARKLGRAGIGMIWKGDVNRRSDGVARAAFLAHAPGDSIAEVERRFFIEEEYTPAALAEACRERGVRTLIIGSWTKVTPALLAVVPLSRIISCALSSDAKRPGIYGWVDPRPDLMGRWGAEQLIGKLTRHESGPPAHPSTLLVPPEWTRL